MDTFGLVSDNAQGIPRCPATWTARRRSPHLARRGNTTKAITKGIAIATAVLAATALFGSVRIAVEGELPETALFSLSVDAPDVLVGLVIGAAVVFLFSGLAISAVAAPPAVW